MMVYWRRGVVIVLCLMTAAYASNALFESRQPSAGALQLSGLAPAASAGDQESYSIASVEPTDEVSSDRHVPEHVPASNAPKIVNDSNRFRYISHGVPAGFEAWLEPQSLALDIFYGGRYLLTALAEYDGEEIVFLDPDEIARSVPGTLDPEAIGDLLSPPLAPNSNRVCSPQYQTDCGRLDTETVGIIFDETRMRADLFVNRALLSGVAETSPRYLPDANLEKITVFQNINSFYTNDDKGNDRFSLFGRSRVGNNGRYGFSDWVSTDSQGLSVDQIGYRHDLRDHVVTIGLFEPSLDMLRGVGGDLLLGAGIEKSMKRRMDLESIISTPIALFLPLRSRVDILRDGRLVSSGFYEAGHQRIDTTRLPSGSYVIELVTTDAGGKTSSEKQLFVKSALLAPLGEALWFVEGGRVSRRAPFDMFPDELDVNIIRGGYRWRQNQWLGFGMAGAATENAAVAEVSASVLLDWLEAGVELQQSSESGRGAGITAVTRRGPHTLTVSSRSLSADDLPQVNEPRYRFIEEDRWQHMAQWIMRINPNANLSVSARLSGGTALAGSRHSTIRYSHHFPAAAGDAFSLAAELGEVDGDVRFMISAQWRGLRQHWTHTMGLDLNGRDMPVDQDDVSVKLATRWRDKALFTDDIDAGITAQASGSSRGMTADVRHGSQWGQGQVAASHTYSDQFEQTQHLASYDTSIVIGESYRPAIGGGPGSGEAGLLLNLDGAEGSVVDIYADGQRQFSARGGWQTPVTLMPYREYEISLKDRGTTLLSFDNKPRRIVLYPGDVETLGWSIKKINIIVGRLHHHEESCSDMTRSCSTLEVPLPNVRIEGVEGFTFTDEDGFFQGEVAEGTTELKARYKGITCKINIAALPVNEGIIRAPSLLCTDESSDKDGHSPGENNGAYTASTQAQSPW